MRFKRMRAAGIAAGAALLVLVSGPANAVGSTSVIDGDGVDYDAACQVGTALTPPGPNSIASSTSSAPGGSIAQPANGDGCEGISTYDGSTEGLDLNSTTSPPAVSLSSDSSDHLVATWQFDGSVPAAGSTTPPDGTAASYDLPDRNFVGGNYFAMFQNKTLQTLAKYTACPPIPPRPTPIVNRWGTWKDGYHFFVAFGANWDGTKWVHSAQLGEYAPDGGFGFYELGTNDGVDSDFDGSPWDYANPYHTVGTGAGQFNVDTSVPGTVTVTAPGVYNSPDTTNCDVSQPYFKYKFAETGNVIANVKGLTTANLVLTLPQTIPLSLTCELTDGAVCESDITTVGGFVYFVDTTSGNSNPGLLNSNITGVSYSGGAIGVQDTLGPGPTCPTPTFGGLVQENPLWTVDTACHIDDDPVSRGSFLQEWWDTVYGFTF